MTSPRLLLFLIGAALSIAQFVMIRDFVSILYGEEVVIVLVTMAFFAGLSLGYAVALRIPEQTFRRLFVATLFLHLTFPFSYRYLAAGFSALDLGGYAFLALLFGYAVLFNTLFAVFLPRLITLGEELTAVARLRAYYGLELAGFVVGFVLISSTWNEPVGRLLMIYWTILAVILYLVLRSVVPTAAFVGLGLLATVFIDRLDAHSNALIYEKKHHLSSPKMLFSVNSPYQRVEVVESRSGTRYLYLDGLLNLNSTDLEALNYYLAEVPAALAKPPRALIIGNGTMSSVKRVSPHAGEVVSVELDPGVLEAGRRFFTPPESLAGITGWSLHVDDGKHFLKKSRVPFDLVVVDVPSPLTIQEAYLHTKEFYALVRDHLTDRGLIAVQLSGPLQRNDRSPARITAALREVFPEVLVIYSERAERGFAYGARSLPFGAEELWVYTRSFDRAVEIIEPADVDRYLRRATPLSVNSMDLVLRRGWERFRRRYF